MNKTNQPTVKELKDLLQKTLTVLKEYDEDIVMDTYRVEFHDPVYLVWKDAGIINLGKDIDTMHIIQ